MGYKDNWIDYYELLGLETNATEEEIKKAYRKMAKIYHPDVNNGEDSVFKQINEAYDILGKENSKKKYDEEYNQRKNGEYKEEEEVEVNYEDVKKHYTKEEQKFAENLAFKKIVEEELEKVNIILENKNELILDAYLNELDKREYYDTVKEFISVGKEYIESLDELAKKAYDIDMLDLEDLINETIDKLIDELDDIPLTPNDAISYVDEIYIKEGIEKKIEEIVLKSQKYVLNLKSMLSPIFLKTLIKVDYKRMILSLMYKGKKIILEIDNIFKLLEITKTIEDEKLNLLKEEYSNVKSIMMWYPKNYEDAIEISKVYEAIEELNKFLNEYRIFDNKINRIAEIIKKHPTNHRCIKLYESAYVMAKDVINEMSKLNDKYESLKNGSSSILFSAQELSNKARKSFVTADKVHREVYEIFKSAESVSYKDKTINYLEKDGLSLEQKIEVIKTLAEIDKVIKASKEMEFFDTEIKKLWKEFISKSKDIEKLIRYLDKIYKFIEDSKELLNNMSKYKELKRKFIKNIITTSSLGIGDISLLTYALKDILFVDEKEAIIKILVGIGILGTTGIFGKKVYDTNKTSKEMKKVKRILQNKYKF